MNRYLLFCYSRYYPSGGKGDFSGDFDSIEDAIQMATEKQAECYEVLDTQTGTWY